MRSVLKPVRVGRGTFPRVHGHGVFLHHVKPAACPCGPTNPIGLPAIRTQTSEERAFRWGRPQQPIARPRRARPGRTSGAPGPVTCASSNHPVRRSMGSGRPLRSAPRCARTACPRRGTGRTGWPSSRSAWTAVCCCCGHGLGTRAAMTCPSPAKYSATWVCASSSISGAASARQWRRRRGRMQQRCPSSERRRRNLDDRN